jgi:hypothetical protein
VAVRVCDSLPGSVMKLRRGVLNEWIGTDLDVRRIVFVDMIEGIKQGEWASIAI